MPWFYRSWWHYDYYDRRSDNDRAVKQADERMQKERHEHERAMKALENADKKERRKHLDASKKRVTALVSQLDGEVRDDQNALKTAKEAHTKNKETRERLTEWVNAFDNYKSGKLKEKAIQISLEKAEQDYNRDMEEVTKAIVTTGQHQDNVGNFLQLTHSLIGATMNTEAEANKLDVALSVFGTIINNECQDKLTIDAYFNEKNLQKFIPILGKEGYTTLDHLRCSDEDAFEADILSLLQTGLSGDKQLELTAGDADGAVDGDEEKEAKSEPEKEGAELCTFLLTKWKLMAYWANFEEEGWDEADDWEDLLEQENEDDFKQIIDKKGKRNQFKKKYLKWKNGAEEAEQFPLLKKMEIKELTNICLNCDSWQTFQDEKVKLTKGGLLVISPLMSEFFGKMNVAVKQIQELLTYKKELNDVQRAALSMKVENGQKIKAITLRKGDNEQRRKWMENCECRIYSASSSAWRKGRIIEVKTDEKEEEWLTVEYEAENEKRSKQIQRYNDGIKPVTAAFSDEKEAEMQTLEKLLDDGDNKSDLVAESSALITASMVSVHVTDSMVSAFNQSELTQRGYTLATSIEDACMRVIRSQGDIRQSVFLAQEILKYKPANRSDDKTQQLWDAVDAGIIQIFKAALEMVKVSAQYFAFFLTFKSAFEYFVSCYRQNENVSLMNSLVRVKQCVRDFNGFKADFSKTIAGLSETAMNCIGECVKLQIGAENWEKSQASLKLTEKIYIDKKKVWDAAALMLDHELDKKKQDRINAKTKEEGEFYQVDMLTARIASKNQYIQQCKKALADFEKIQI